MEYNTDMTSVSILLFTVCTDCTKALKRFLFFSASKHMDRCFILISEECHMHDVIHTTSSGTKSPCTEFGNRMSCAVSTPPHMSGSLPPRWFNRSFNKYFGRGDSLLFHTNLIIQLVGNGLCLFQYDTTIMFSFKLRLS